MIALTLRCAGNGVPFRKGGRKMQAGRFGGGREGKARKGRPERVGGRTTDPMALLVTSGVMMKFASDVLEG